MPIEPNARVERIGTTVYADVDHVLVALFSYHRETEKRPVSHDEKTQLLDRLVACWNACHGIRTEALNAGIVDGMLAIVQAAAAGEDATNPWDYGDCTQAAFQLLEPFGLVPPSVLDAESANTCPDCSGSGRGGPNTTDGGEDDDCRTCSGEGVVLTTPTAEPEAL